LGAGHKTYASIALCLGYQEWLDIGLWECSTFSKEGPNSKKWHDDTFKAIRLMRDMLVDIHKAIKGDMVQLRKVIVWELSTAYISCGQLAKAISPAKKELRSSHHP